MSEERIGAAVLSWLCAEEWDVYQEVHVHGRVADIVARRGSVALIVELKKTLSLAVLNQAWRWEGYAHMRAVAVPEPTRGWKRNAAQDFARHVAGRYGIGVVDVGVRAYCRWSTRPGWTSRPTMLSELIGRLRPEHKTFANAGTANGGHFTPFRDTRRRVVSYVSEHPGATMSEVVASIDHHYASDKSARATLARWIVEGVINELRIESQPGRSPRVWLCDKETAV